MMGWERRERQQHPNSLVELFYILWYTIGLRPFGTETEGGDISRVVAKAVFHSKKGWQKVALHDTYWDRPINSCSPSILSLVVVATLLLISGSSIWNFRDSLSMGKSRKRREA